MHPPTLARAVSAGIQKKIKLDEAHDQNEDSNPKRQLCMHALMSSMACADPEVVIGGPDTSRPLKIHNNIGFLNNPKNHKATKQAFKVGP